VVKYRTTNYKLLNNITYRLKSSTQKDWRLTTSTQLELVGLPPGKYQYEIQSANEDGLWSKSAFVTFVINPPWWRTHTFYLVLAMTISTILYLLYNNRTNQIKQKSELNAKINKLEKMALQSQMNPHFISNAFASLQYLINVKKLDLAEDYLSDLSSLIRRILDNSRKAEVTLKEELDLLQNYISLEQLRFEKRFEFDTKLDTGIDLLQIYIPPMILQPLIENAITHGIYHLKDRQGKLTLSVLKENGFINISIDDNGIGRLKASTIPTSKPHKSFALDILRERIENYNQSNKGKISLNIVDRDQVTEFGTMVTLSLSKNY
jgi:sensor histidine kinase YesM